MEHINNSSKVMKPADWIGLPQMKLPLLHAAAKCTVTSLLPLIAFARLRIGVCACDCNCADLRLLISNAHYPVRDGGAVD